MNKREEKLNRLWRYLQKTLDKKTLSMLNNRAFLYSTGHLSYEQVLIELVATYYGKNIITDEETKAVISIIENK